MRKNSDEKNVIRKFINNKIEIIMETITINIINPKAKKLIKDLADLNLISIRKPNQKSTLKRLLEMTRKANTSSLTMEEIISEVEIVRKERYEATKNNS